MILTVTLNAAIDRTVAVPNFRLGHRHRAVESRTVAGRQGHQRRPGAEPARPPGDRRRLRRRPDRHPRARTAARRVGPDRLHPDRRRDADQPRGDRPDLGRADRDQRARPGGQRRGGQDALRADRLPGRRREDLRARRLAAARRRRRPLRAPDRRPAPPRRRRRARRRGRGDAGRACAPAPRWSPRTSARPRSWSARSSPTAPTSPPGLAELVRLGAGEAAITRPEGCVAAVGEGAERRLLEVHTEPLEPVSTVGSGDAFVAGYVAARYEGRSPEDCLAYGVACGAESTQHFGAGTVDRNQVERLLGEVAVHDLEVPAEV